MTEANTPPSSLSERLKSSASKWKATTAKGLKAAATKGAEFAKKMQEEPGRATARRLVESLVGDWVQGGLGAEWTESDDDMVVKATEGASLKVSWRKGEFALYGVKIKPKTLEGLGLGWLKVVSGTIKALTLVVPWTRLGTSPVSLALDGVTLELGLCDPRRDPLLFPDDKVSPGNSELLEIFDALRNQLRAKLLGSAKRRGSIFRRGARKMALRALSKVDLHLTDVSLAYQGLNASLHRFNAVYSGGDNTSIAADAFGEDILISTGDDSLFALSRGAFGLEDKNVAGIQDVQGLRTPDPSRLLRELTSRARGLRTAAKIYDIKARIKRRFGHLSTDLTERGRWTFLDAARAVICQRRRVLDTWIEAVRLATLRREYLEARERNAKRVDDIEATTPLRVLLAFRDETYYLTDDSSDANFISLTTNASTAAPTLINVASFDASFGPVFGTFIGIEASFGDDFSGLQCHCTEVSGAVMSVKDLAFESGHLAVGGAPRIDDLKALRCLVAEVRSFVDVWTGEHFVPRTKVTTTPLSIQVSGTATVRLQTSALAVSAVRVVIDGGIAAFAKKADLFIDDDLVFKATGLELSPKRQSAASCFYVLDEMTRIDGLAVTIAETIAVTLEKVAVSSSNVVANIAVASNQLRTDLADVLALSEEPESSSSKDRRRVQVSVTEALIGGDLLRLENLRYQDRGLRWAHAVLRGLKTGAVEVSFDLKEDAGAVDIKTDAKCSVRIGLATMSFLDIFGPWKTAVSLFFPVVPRERSRIWSLRCPHLATHLLAPPLEPKMDVIDLDEDRQEEPPLQEPLQVGASEILVTIDLNDDVVTIGTEAFLLQNDGRIEGPGIFVVRGRDGWKIDAPRLTATTSKGLLAALQNVLQRGDEPADRRPVRVSLGEATIITEDLLLDVTGLSLEVHDDDLKLDAAHVALRQRRRGQYLVDDARIRVALAKKNLDVQLLKGNGHVGVYISRGDVECLDRFVHDELALLFPPQTKPNNLTTSIAFVGETVVYLVDHRDAPALRFRLRDTTLEMRGTTQVLTLGFDGADAFDDRREFWSAVVPRSTTTCDVCAQNLPSELRIVVGRLCLDLDSHLAAALTRLLRDTTSQMMDSKDEAISVKNDCGVDVRCGEVAVSKGETVELEMKLPPATKRDGRGLDALRLSFVVSATQELVVQDVPVPRRAIVDGVTDQILLPRVGAVVEYSKRSIRLRSAVRLRNGCRDSLHCRVVLDDDSMSPGVVVPPFGTVDAPLSWRFLPRSRKHILESGPKLVVWRENIDAQWLDCGDVASLFRRSGDDVNGDVVWQPHRGGISSHSRSPHPSDDGPYEELKEDIRTTKMMPKRHRSLRYGIDARTGATLVATAIITPARRLTNKLAAKVRIATARRWPQKREDYADVYDLEANDGCDLGAADARFWCLRVDGYAAQSEWYDVSATFSSEDLPGAAIDEADHTVRFVVSRQQTVEEDDVPGESLRIDLRRKSDVDLELVCPLVCVDQKTGLGLEFHKSSSTEATPGPRAMLDVGPHSAIVVRSKDAVSPPFVPSAFLATNTGHARIALAGDNGLFELGLYEPEPRTVVFVPRIAVVHECHSQQNYEVIVKQQVHGVSRIARARHNEWTPFFWEKASPPFALDVALVTGEWTSVSASRFEGGFNLTERLLDADPTQSFGLELRRYTSRASFELVVCDPILKAEPSEQPSSSSWDHILFGKSARFEIQALIVRLREAGVTFSVEGGVVATLGKQRDYRGALEIKALVATDDRTQQVAFHTKLVDFGGHQTLDPRFAATALRLTGRLTPASRDQPTAGAVALAVEVGDAALRLDEACAWRVLDAARKTRDALGPPPMKRKRPPVVYDVEIVRLGAWSLRPATIAPDGAARRRLLEELGEADDAVTKLVLNVVGALPKLGIENADIDFEAAELRPRHPATLGDLAALVARTYAAQLKKQWWTLASSLSLTAFSSSRSSTSFPAQQTSRRSVSSPVMAVVTTAATTPQTPHVLFEYSVVIDQQGPLGLVIVWRDDGLVVVNQKKLQDDPVIRSALSEVKVGDVVVAVHGRGARSYEASDALVAAMKHRPLAVRFARMRTAFTTLVVPASEKSLGFSVARRDLPSHGGLVLVLTDIREGSPLYRAGLTQPGPRLLFLNGDDVRHISLDDLTRRASHLAYTDRSITLAIDYYDASDDDLQHSPRNSSSSSLSGLASSSSPSSSSRGSPTSSATSRPSPPPLTDSPRLTRM